MVTRLRTQESAVEIAEWFFQEAAHQMQEADAEQAEVIGRTFGIDKDQCGEVCLQT